MLKKYYFTFTPMNNIDFIQLMKFNDTSEISFLSFNMFLRKGMFMLNTPFGAL